MESKSFLLLVPFWPGVTASNRPSTPKPRLNTSFLQIRELCLRKRMETGGIQQIWLVIPHLSSFKKKKSAAVFPISKAIQMPGCHKLHTFPTFSASLNPYYHQKKILLLWWEKNAIPNTFYIHSCLMLGLRFPAAHTNYKDMPWLIMRAKGSTCEETWFKMLSAGKAISSHQHCHGLSKTQPGLPSSKVQEHFFFFFFLSPP